MENMWDIKKVLESKGNTYNMVEVQANSECRSLTSSLTWSLVPPYLQIDVHDASDHRFG
jgi:phage gp29-like protein